MQISTMESLDMFVSAIAIVLVLWVFAMVMAHLADEILWWALPTKAKIVIKDIEWRVETFGAQWAVWEYNNYNRLFNRHPNVLTAWLRTNAEAAMRIAIGHAEDRLEKLSLLLNEIQE